MTTSRWTPVSLLFPGTSRLERGLRGLALLVFLLAAAGWILWERMGPAGIEAAYNGQSFSMVNLYVGLHRGLDPEGRTVAYFLENGMPVVRRLCGIIMVLALALWLLGGRLKAQRHRYFSATAAPENLAFFRIAIFATLLFYTDLPNVLLFSGFPRELQVAPPGWGVLLSVLPVNPTTAAVAGGLFLWVCGMALMGLYTRVSATLAVIVGLYVLGIPQFYGKIDHYHHLLWFAALLAASPCADAWSVDAWLKKKRGLPAAAQTAQRYAVPLRFVWLLMGVIYFFAGFWKFVIGGLDWGAGENLIYILYAQWYRVDWLPFFRIDEVPWLAAVAGVGVMFWEMGFIFLVLSRRTRWIAVAGGLLFHASVYLLAHINFWNLVACYAAFVPVGALLKRSQEVVATQPPHRSPAHMVGSVLLAVNIFCGFTLLDTWPVAVYPTFAGVKEPLQATLSLEADLPDGTTVALIPWRREALREAIGASRMLGLVWQVVRASPGQERQQRARAVLAVMKPYIPELEQAVAVRLYQDYVAVAPARWKEPPVRRMLIVVVE